MVEALEDIGGSAPVELTVAYGYKPGFEMSK